MLKFLSLIFKSIFIIGLLYVVGICLYYCYLPVIYHIMTGYSTQPIMNADSSWFDIIIYKITSPPIIWIGYFDNLSLVNKFVYFICALPIAILSYTIIFALITFTVLMYLWDRIVAPIIGTTLKPIIQASIKNN